MGSSPNCQLGLEAQACHPSGSRAFQCAKRLIRSTMSGPKAVETPSSHNGSMEEVHVFTIDVAQDARQPGRYRWSVSENMKVRDTSFYSFTTRQEAQADANKFVEKLKAIWQPH
jgi:hypothetical protein